MLSKRQKDRQKVCVWLSKEDLAGLKFLSRKGIDDKHMYETWATFKKLNMVEFELKVDLSIWEREKSQK